MHIIPGLFLQGQKVVSLYKGTENAEKKVYAKRATSYAEIFKEQGARTLFVVDLNGTERARARELKESFEKELWWAGGVRDREALNLLFQSGVDKVVLGQKAESIYEEALKVFGPDRIVAGIQAFHNENIPELCALRKEQGFTDIFVKDMNADGTLFHPNFDLMEKCVYFSGAKIYASGGVGLANDIRLLAQAKVQGVIIARAFYENQLFLPDLMAEFEASAR